MPTAAEITVPPQPPAAVPVPPVQPTRKQPGATDGNYFVNCQSSDGTVSSGIAYYSHLNPGQNAGQRPDHYVDVLHGSYVTWEQTRASNYSRDHPIDAGGSLTYKQ